MKKVNLPPFWVLIGMLFIFYCVGFAFMPRLMHFNQYSTEGESMSETALLNTNNFFIPSWNEVVYLFTNHIMYSIRWSLGIMIILLIIGTKLYNIDSTYPAIAFVFIAILGSVMYLFYLIGYPVVINPTTMIVGFVILFLIMLISIWISNLIKTQKDQDKWRKSH